MQTRYPEMTVLPGATPGQPLVGQPLPPKPDRESTGSISRRNIPQPVQNRDWHWNQIRGD